VKIFVFEMVPGGGLAAQPLRPRLAREGDLMLHALLQDLSDLPHVRVAASRDPRLPPVPGVAAMAPAPGEEPWALYARGLRSADAAWPIAPETDGALERLSRDTVALGKRLLGSHPDAVRLAASKRETARVLGAAGVPAVPTFAAGDRLPPLAGAWVVKPDDGAGCDGVLVVPDWRVAGERLAGDPGRLVGQPWIDGCALSLSLLCCDGRAALLCCNRQHVRLVDGRPVLEAITVNTLSKSKGDLADLGMRIAAAIPGLWGYVGVDLVLTQQGPVVLEINPRLTTSYCGLRAALGINPAALVLDVLATGAMGGWRAPARAVAATVSLVGEHGD
jgi:predicted ATP-grasp superfamily ATP-dependent carboligase